jgi:hypothetical protein
LTLSESSCSAPGLTGVLLRKTARGCYDVAQAALKYKPPKLVTSFLREVRNPMRVWRARLVVSLCLVFILCAVLATARRGSAALTPQAAVKAAPAADVHGFDTANLDRGASACQDFNQFANGGWIEHNPVPPAFARWGKFEELREKNQTVLRDILEAAAHNQKVKRGTTEQKVGDFYAACMDEPSIEAAGAKPLAPEFERIAAIKDVRGLQDQIAHMHSLAGFQELAIRHRATFAGRHLAARPRLLPQRRRPLEATPRRVREAHRQDVRGGGRHRRDVR